MEPVRFTVSHAAAHRMAREALAGEPRTRIVMDSAGYLRAEARSRIMRFIDDVEILVDTVQRVFRFRSASRMGRSDWGVNRARMARVTARLRAAS